MIQAQRSSQEQRFTALITGGPGTGKTTMALTAPRPIHVIDVDRKMHLIPQGPHLKDVTYSQYDLTISGRKRITIASAPDAKNPSAGFDPSVDPKVYKQVVEELNTYIDMKERKVPFPFQTLVIDTGSRLGEHLEFLLKKLQAHDTMTISDWKMYINNWLELLNGLMSLSSYKEGEEEWGCSCNIIMTSHESTFVDEITKEMRVLPAIPGQIGERIAGFFQESYYLVPKTEQNRMKVNVLTHADRKYSLTSQLTDIVEVPADFARILAGEFRGDKAEKYMENQTGGAPHRLKR